MEEKIIRKLSGLNEETRSLVVELIELFYFRHTSNCYTCKKTNLNESEILESCLRLLEKNEPYIH